MPGYRKRKKRGKKRKGRLIKAGETEQQAGQKSGRERSVPGEEIVEKVEKVKNLQGEQGDREVLDKEKTGDV